MVHHVSLHQENTVLHVIILVHVHQKPLEVNKRVLHKFVVVVNQKIFL
jgi:hypothetical protein